MQPRHRARRERVQFRGLREGGGPCRRRCPGNLRGAFRSMEMGPRSVWPTVIDAEFERGAQRMDMFCLTIDDACRGFGYPVLGFGNK